MSGVIDWDWDGNTAGKEFNEHFVSLNKSGIGGAVWLKAIVILGAAQMILNEHTAHNMERRIREQDTSPHAYVDVTRGSKQVDSFVNLNDPAAAAIESKTRILRRAKDLFL